MSDFSNENPTELSITSNGITRIPRQTWFIITILGIAGQIAWAVENSWFNVFVYDEITQDPGPIAWMVAVSAITATLTSIIIGALSDRTHSKMGKRKPYILFGYILWGISTAVFPTVKFIPSINIAIFMVIVVDAVMTFFGSTANDASFNAWIADITDTTNRGRVQGILMMAALIANLIAIGASGFIIEQFGFFVFFYILGGFVTIAGLIAGIPLKEPLRNQILEQGKEKPFFEDIIFTFKPSTIKANKTLYFLLATMAAINIGGQVSSPYLFVYLENYLNFTKSEVSIVGGTVILITAIISVVYGMLSHKINRKYALFVTICLNICFGIILAFSFTMVSVMIVYTLVLSTSMITSINLESWIQDLYPVEDRGKFQGIRMVAYVAIPMVIGPIIGNQIIRHYGAPTFDDFGAFSGYIPSPEIFLYGAIVGLLALIPLYFVFKSSPSIY